MQQRDVLIVGAGPAGARAACLLARAGARVRLFDGSHPREKPCGGGLTARAVQLVRDAVDFSCLPSVAADMLRFEGRTAFSEFSLPAFGATPDTALLIVDRRSFDGALLEAACRTGAEHVAERVRDVRVATDGVEVITRSRSWHGDFVLGADGANSLVRRRVRAAFTRAQMSLATGFFLHGVTSSEVRIRAVDVPPGYIWSFPRATHLAVGICSQADVAGVEALRRVVCAWLAENHLADRARAEPYSWPIPSLASADLRHEYPAGDRWMLLGDAAGLVDPLTREGIYFALASGQFAAEAICAGRTAEYVSRLRDEIYPELGRAADVKARFFTSGFTDLMVRGFERSPAVRNVMVDLVAGRQPYATLKRRLVCTFEIGLAARLLWLQVSGRVAAARRPPHVQLSADH